MSEVEIVGMILKYIQQGTPEKISELGFCLVQSNTKSMTWERRDD